MEVVEDTVHVHLVGLLHRIVQYQDEEGVRVTTVPNKGIILLVQHTHKNYGCTRYFFNHT